MNKDAIELESCVQNYVNTLPDRIKKQREKVFQKGELSDIRSEITSEWYIANLFDVTHVITCGVAKRPDYVESGIPFLSAQNARPFKANLNKIKYITQAAFESFTVGAKPERDDVLYTRVGNCGEAAKITFDFDFAIYVSLTLIKPIHSILNVDYLVAFLNSKYGLIQAGQGAIGIGLQNLNVDNVRRYVIPLPPLAEQQQIAQKLDELLAQVDTLKTRLDAIPKILKRFRQSVLAAAVSGRLTEDVTFEVKTLGDIIEIGPQNGIYKPSSFYGEGNRIVRIDGFYDGEMCDWEKIKRVQLDKDELSKWQLNVSDILINRVNSIEYLGKCALVRTLPEPAVFESNIMRIKLDLSQANPEYVAYFLSSVIGLERLRANAKLAVNQASINQTDVKNCQIELPPIDVQEDIVRKIKQLFAYADQIEQRVKDAQARVNHLTQSILAKAFRGELTADWRAQNPELISGENSAAALLERIKAEREAAVKPKRKAKN